MDWPGKKIVNTLPCSRSVMGANELKQNRSKTSGAKVAPVAERCSMHKEVARTFDHRVLKMNNIHALVRKIRRIRDGKSYDFVLERGLFFKGIRIGDDGRRCRECQIRRIDV